MDLVRSTNAPEVKPVPSEGRQIAVEKAGEAAYVMLGYPAPGLDNPDYYPMCVANVLLGGNKSSLLFTSLRENQGLGYQVESQFRPCSAPVSWSHI